MDRAAKERIRTACPTFVPYGLALSWPSPLRLIDEECAESEYRDKSLGLWRLEDIQGD